MFLSNGIINIKNILIISLIFQLIISFVISLKIIKKTKTDNIISCYDHFFEQTVDKDNIFSEFEQICQNLQSYPNNENQIFYLSLIFDLDSSTYILDLAKVNQLYYGLKYLEQKSLLKSSLLKKK